MTHGKLYAVVLRKKSFNKTMVSHFFVIVLSIIWFISYTTLYTFWSFFFLWGGGGMVERNQNKCVYEYLVFKMFCYHIQIAYSEVRYYWYITIEFGQKYS